MIFVVNSLNNMIRDSFPTMKEALEYLEGSSRYTVDTSFLIIGGRKEISSNVVFEVEGEKARTIQEERNEIIPLKRRNEDE